MRQKSGQTALILILLAAAALIFLAITLNWGRIAQIKAMITVANDQAGALLASEVASYGEMEKQTYLKDTNQITESTGILTALFGLLLALLVLALSGGTGAAFIFSLLAVVLATVNLALQAMVIQPGITSLWNSLQKTQPVPQQMYEQGITTALQGSVTDQVNVADYFDWNANGKLGLSPSGVPEDEVSRFALYYTDRLKMLNKPPIPQVLFFYDQLGEFLNGETCGQSQSDNYNYGMTVNAGCVSAGVKPFSGAPCTPSSNCTTSGINCITNPIDPVCEAKIPGGFQLNDSCTGSNPTNTATYSPYCDPCCQVKPPATCKGASNCFINNPYNSSGSYPYLYDQSFQNYPAALSFLDQMGRDQQKGPFSANITAEQIIPPASPGGVPLVSFPNGVYPFFWLADEYSMEVDNINSGGLNATQYHWCTPSVASKYPGEPFGYDDLTQLGKISKSGTTSFVLKYGCSGQNCCANYISGKVQGGSPVSLNGHTIDAVGSPSTGSNPGLDPSFGEGGVNNKTWLPGNNEMCLASFPYNGASDTGMVDGTCEWTGTASPPPPLGAASPGGPMTADKLDDMVKTLSDFDIFALGILNKDPGTLSSTFNTWFPQADTWINSSTGRLIPLPATLSSWIPVLNNWINANFMNNSDWCLPSQANILQGNASTPENTYISGQLKGKAWGQMPSLLACLNFNAGEVPTANPAGTSNFTETPINGPAFYYQQCSSALSPAQLPSCPPLPAACAATQLGRSLNGPIPAPLPPSTTCVGGCAAGSNGCTCTTTTNTTYTTTTTVSTTTCTNSSGGSCAAGTTGCSCSTKTTTTCGFNPKYIQWVNDNLTLFTDEAPKFAARAQYLTDMYTRIQPLPALFQSAVTALNNFLKPCAGVNCSQGGPAAQLIYAHSQPDPIMVLPNSVIYGWVDDTYSNGHPGYAHLVKVTAYSAGRMGKASLALPTPSPQTKANASVLPWIETVTHSTNFIFFSLPTSRSYTLVDRDGWVYMDVKRWDEDHSSNVLFPNGRPLWQQMFHYAPGAQTTGQGLMQVCNGLIVPGKSTPIGFGLEPQTVSGLGSANMLPKDLTALSNVFMLNDNINGTVDPNSHSGAYAQCLNMANKLLSFGTESHVCAQYIASLDASKASGNGDKDYSLKFVNCGKQPEDL
jgi:hypothetical protein